MSSYSFLSSLPGEIRNMIYAECLLTDNVVAITNLRNDETSRPAHQALGLTPTLLRTCKQVYLEAVQILYNDNVFFAELQPAWTFHRSAQWQRCFQLSSDELSFCLGCIPQGRLPASEQPVSWSPAVAYVRKLQVSIRPYSYLEWCLKQPSAFPATIDCQHTTKRALPPELKLDLLVIRVNRRALMTRHNSRIRDNWALLALRYETGDAGEWRASGKRDMSRELRRVLGYGSLHSGTVVLAGTAFRPYVDCRVTGRLPSFLLRTLQTGCILRSSIGIEEDDDGLSEVDDAMRERFRYLSSRDGDMTVPSTSQSLALQSIYY